MKNKSLIIGGIVFLGAVLFGLIAAPIAVGLAFFHVGGDNSSDTSGTSASGNFSGDCRAKGLAYGSPSTSQADREAVFGKADGKSHIEEVTFFGKSVKVHEKVAACLRAVEKDLKAQETNYDVRVIGGLRWPPDDLGWFHPYGAAIDINPDDNPHCGGIDPYDPKGLCGKDKPYDMPKSWVDTFKRYGFYWGGRFSSPDYMHFEWHGEKP